MHFNRSEQSVDRSLQELSLDLQFRQEGLESGAVEFPSKRTRLSIGQLLVQLQPLLDLVQAGKVVRGQDLPLDDREINLHLIQPTGMHRRMDHDRLAIRLAQPFDRRLAAMRRAIIHHPEHSVGRAIRLGRHHLIDQPAERIDSGPLLAPAQNLSTSDVPRRQVLQGSASLVLVLDAHRSPRGGRQRRVTADPGLDAGLLVGADDVVPAAQRLAFPGAGIEVEDSTRFLGEPRISWEDPVLILPGLDRVGKGIKGTFLILDEDWAI
jgi:hypothetical protein